MSPSLILLFIEYVWMAGMTKLRGGGGGGGGGGGEKETGQGGVKREREVGDPACLGAE